MPNITLLPEAWSYFRLLIGDPLSAQDINELAFEQRTVYLVVRIRQQLQPLLYDPIEKVTQKTLIECFEDICEASTVSERMRWSDELVEHGMATWRGDGTVRFVVSEIVTSMLGMLLVYYEHGVSYGGQLYTLQPRP